MKCDRAIAENKAAVEAAKARLENAKSNLENRKCGLENAHDEIKRSGKTFVEAKHDKKVISLLYFFYLLIMLLGAFLITVAVKMKVVSNFRTLDAAGVGICALVLLWLVAEVVYLLVGNLIENKKTNLYDKRVNFYETPGTIVIDKDAIAKPFFIAFGIFPIAAVALPIFFFFYYPVRLSSINKRVRETKKLVNTNSIEKYRQRVADASAELEEARRMLAELEAFPKNARKQYEKARKDGDMQAMLAAASGSPDACRFLEGKEIYDKAVKGKEPNMAKVRIAASYGYTDACIMCGLDAAEKYLLSDASDPEKKAYASDAAASLKKVYDIVDDEIVFLYVLCAFEVRRLQDNEKLYDICETINQNKLSDEYRGLLESIKQQLHDAIGREKYHQEKQREIQRRREKEANDQLATIIYNNLTSCSPSSINTNTSSTYDEEYNRMKAALHGLNYDEIKKQNDDARIKHINDLS